MTTQHLFHQDLKTIGLLKISADNLAGVNTETYQDFIKVMFIPKGCTIRVDFRTYKTKRPTLLFISPNQFLGIDSLCNEESYLLYYNRDFYCIQIHDAEVACDGILFNNIHNMPVVELKEAEAGYFDHLFSEMENEFELEETSREEMIRTYLKQLLIRSTRIWKKQHLEKEATVHHTETEFFRKFTTLVDLHYKQKHTVADYADLLFMASKTITHKFKRMKLPQPNEVIKNRIVLEAKRLLVHTTMTAKEIAFELGYEDPAYFSRMFLVNTGESPSGFRTKYLRQAV